MKYSQRDIILVPFPFTDLTSTKVRPAIVVSSATALGGDLIVCGITSKSHATKEVVLHTSDMEEGGLPLTSYVRLGKIVTLDRNIIKGRLGKVNTKKYESIRRGIVTLLSTRE